MGGNPKRDPFPGIIARFQTERICDPLLGWFGNDVVPEVAGDLADIDQMADHRMVMVRPCGFAEFCPKIEKQWIQLPIKVCTQNIRDQLTAAITTLASRNHYTVCDCF